MRLHEAVAEFVSWGRVRYAPLTLSRYEDALQRFILFNGNTKLHNVTLQRCLDFQADLLASGLTKVSVALYSSALRKFIRHFFIQGIIKLNYELIPYPKGQSKSWTPVERVDVEKMISHITHVTPFYVTREQLIIKFLFSSGVRVSELCELKISDLNMGEHEALIKTKKTNDTRMIFWDDDAHEAILAYLPVRAHHAHSDYLLVNRKGFMITPRQIERIVEHLSHRAGLSQRIVPHSFRHGFGMRGVANNVNLRHLQVMLGHKHLSSTETYLQWKESNVRSDYKKLMST
jgi:site-specific recombinase XerD